MKKAVAVVTHLQLINTRIKLRTQRRERSINFLCFFKRLPTGTGFAHLLRPSQIHQVQLSRLVRTGGQIILVNGDDKDRVAP